jgi:hypothetical protein
MRYSLEARKRGYSGGVLTAAGRAQAGDRLPLTHDITRFKAWVAWLAIAALGAWFL